MKRRGRAQLAGEHPPAGQYGASPGTAGAAELSNIWAYIVKQSGSVVAADGVIAFPKLDISCYVSMMNSHDALETLRKSEHALRARGVRRAALFGSVAR